MSDIKEITICGIPYTMQQTDGGVLFSEKSGFWGLSCRLMFEYKEGLWYLVDIKASFNTVPVAHLTKIYEFLKEVRKEHT